MQSSVVQNKVCRIKVHTCDIRWILRVGGWTTPLKITAQHKQNTSLERSYFSR